MEQRWLTVGKIVNTHGIRGELKIFSQTDFPEERFASGNVLTMLEPESGRQQQVEVQSAREHKNTFIVKLKGYDNINDVEKFKGWVLKVSVDNLDELEEGEYYHYQIIGCSVVTDEGQELGKVTEILRPGANDVWVVQPDKGQQVLIPVIDDVLLSVDVDNKRIVIKLLEGLI